MAAFTRWWRTVSSLAARSTDVAVSPVPACATVIVNAGSDALAVPSLTEMTMFEYKGCTISIHAVLSGGAYKDPTYAISRNGEFIHHGVQRGHYAVLDAAKSAAEKSAVQALRDALLDVRAGGSQQDAETDAHQHANRHGNFGSRLEEPRKRNNENNRRQQKSDGLDDDDAALDQHVARAAAQQHGHWQHLVFHYRVSPGQRRQHGQNHQE